MGRLGQWRSAVASLKRPRLDFPSTAVYRIQQKCQLRTSHEIHNCTASKRPAHLTWAHCQAYPAGRSILHGQTLSCNNERPSPAGHICTDQKPCQACASYNEQAPVQHSMCFQRIACGTPHFQHLSQPAVNPHHSLLQRTAHSAHNTYILTSQTQTSETLPRNKPQNTPQPRKTCCPQTPAVLLGGLTKNRTCTAIAVHCYCYAAASYKGLTIPLPGTITQSSSAAAEIELLHY